MKIIADAHISYIENYFGNYGELILKSGRHITASDVQEADMLLVRSITRVDKKLLANSRVKFVGSVTAGADHLDTSYLDANGIEWSVAKGFNAPPVADYVVSVVAALQRKHILASEGLKAAVIGIGSVGNLVAERLRWLGMEVVLCDPIRAQQESNFNSITLDDIHDVDFITLHVPLTKSGDYPTYHFINKEFLQRQKHHCVLVNASRGAVIDTAALHQYGAHLHWCLDVWENEPNIDKNILQQTLIATPHIAGYSVQSKVRGIDMIYHIACEKKIITPQLIEPVHMPVQQLAFSEGQYHWQEIVLGIFNPLVMTAMMNTQLLPAEDNGHSFDEMRHHFNYRHEFAYTTARGVQMSEKDKLVMQQLAVNTSN